MKNQLINLKLDFKNSNNIENDVSLLIKQSQKIAYQAVDIVLLQRNWLIGKRIHEEILSKTRKENYGLEIIKQLAESLSKSCGRGFNKTNLYNFYKFYTMYKTIFQSPTGKSFLSWTHYSCLISVDEDCAREWYENEALNNNWSVRTLQRNIETQYYYRILAKQITDKEGQSIEEQLNKLEHIKNPVILEFLGIHDDSSIKETELESAIISNIQKMLMELGKGYAFIARQYRIHTEARDYYIDLVFYNYILKCFLLIDLKTGRIEHQDVGQMDMHVRMFDELQKDKNDNPTLGLVLCSQTDKDIARYSILKGSEQLFASKYKLYLPTENELKAEIEYQKELFYLNRTKNNH